MKILMPVIQGAGIEIYHRRLAAGLSGAGNCIPMVPFSPKWEFFPPGMKWQLRQALKSSTPPDLIHASGEYSCYFQIPGIPLLATLHHSSIDEEILPSFSWPVRFHHRWVLRRILAKTVRVADRLVTDSFFSRESFHQVMGKDLAIEVIHVGLDPDVFKPGPSVPSSSSGRCVLFFSGNPSRRKGFDLLDPLMKALGIDYQLRYTTGLRASGKPLLASPNAVFLGRLPEEQLIEEINRADIILQPSRREGFGMSILEGMACGKPVVSTHCSSIPEVLDHEEGGLLCEPGSVDQLVRAIQRLAQSVELRRKMGLHNRRQVLARFTLVQMVEAYWKLYQQLSGVKA
jgi:glycosyltransferase involved in cell wall biosynthesis